MAALYLQNNHKYINVDIYKSTAKQYVCLLQKNSNLTHSNIDITYLCYTLCKFNSFRPKRHVVLEIQIKAMGFGPMLFCFFKFN